MDKPELMTAEEVARALKTAPAKIKSGVLNGTMPIGTVLRDPNSTHDRVVIVRARWERWINGDDLKGRCM